MPRRALVLIASLALSGCGEGAIARSTGTGGQGATTSVGGAGGAGGGFSPPSHGPVWEGCQPGEASLDGACVPAGIPEDLCGDHFQPDGDGACEPVLPSFDCPPGQMAVPGDKGCAPVAPCGAGTWDGIPVEAGTEYVDASFQGTSDGSASQPWSTVGEAVVAAAPDALVAIGPGVYTESVVIGDKPLRLWGKCPAETRIDAGGSPAIFFDEQSGEVHRLTLTGSRGVQLVGAGDVLVEEAWLKDATHGAEATSLSNAYPTMTVRRTLISGSVNRGIYGFGGSLTVEASVIRDTNSAGLSNASQAIEFGDAPGASALADLVVRRTLIERGRRRAIEGQGAATVLEDVVVRDLATLDQDTEAAVLLVGPAAGYALSTLQATRVVIERSDPGGLRLYDVEGQITALVVADSDPSFDDLEGGAGLEIGTISAGGPIAEIEVTHAAIDRVESRGVLVLGALTDLVGVRIRDVAPWRGDNTAGQGVLYQWQPETGLPAGGSIDGLVVERAHEVGVAASAAILQIDGALVADTLPRPDGDFGRGVNLQHAPGSPIATSGTIRRSWIAGATEAGIGSHGADLVVDDVLVQQVGAGNLDAGGCFNFQRWPTRQGSALVSRARGEDCAGFGALFFDVPGAMTTTELRRITAPAGSFGDGATAVIAPVELSSMVVAEAVRAGTSAFGAPLSFQDVVLDCSSIDINGESFASMMAELDDRGGNRCGCGGEERACKSQSAGLEPPSPIDP